MNHPVVAHLAVVFSLQCKFLGVLRPVNRHRRRPQPRFVGITLVLFPKLFFLFRQQHARIAVSFHSVRRHLRFHHARIAWLFQGFRVVLCIHQVQIVAPREYRGFSSRRHGSPHWFFLRRFKVVQPRDFPRCQIVLKIKCARFLRFLSRRSRRLALLLSLLHPLLLALLLDVLLALFFFRLIRHHRVLSNLHFESYPCVFFHQFHPLEGKMLRVIGEICKRRERRGHLGVVPQRSLGLLHRVHKVVSRPLRGLEAVPESVGLAEPVRRHGQIKNQLVELIGQKPLFECVVGGNVRCCIL